MKRICIDLTPFEMLDRHGGISRYGAYLLRELVALPQAESSRVEVCAMTRSHMPPVSAEEALAWAANPGEEIPADLHRRQRIRRMGRLLKRARVDLFHAIEPKHLPRRRPFLTVSTCHDLIPLVLPNEGRTRREIDKRRTEDRKQYRGVDHVVAVSHTTRRDLVNELAIAESHITVVQHGVDRRLFASEQAKCDSERRRGLPERYFVSVGSDYYRKNQPRLVEAWCQIADRIPEGLVLVGRALYESTFDRIEEDVRSRGLASRFAWLDDVDDAALPALYRGATAAVAPSLYEGFGMTLLEAMACGTPVVCCDNAAYRELAENAAIFFDGLSVAGIAERLLEISRDEVLAKDLVERGFQRIEPMTWRRTAEQTWEVYERLLWPK